MTTVDPFRPDDICKCYGSFLTLACRVSRQTVSASGLNGQWLMLNELPLRAHNGRSAFTIVKVGYLI